MRRFFTVLLITVAAFAFLGLMLPARAAEQKLNDADRKFLQAAAEINMAEVQLGQLAQDNASASAIKKFGMRLAADHSRMNKGLRELAAKKGAALPEKLDSKHQDLVAQLTKLKGADFDRTFSKDMVSGHGKAIQVFEAEATAGQDPEVKAWAQKWLPTLREYLTLAREAVQEVKGAR